MGIPRFLRHERVGYDIHETELPKAGWKALFAFIAAIVIGSVYWGPLKEGWQHLRFGSDEEDGGSVSVQVLPQPASKPTSLSHGRTQTKGHAPNATSTSSPTRTRTNGSVFSGTMYDLYSLDPVPGIAVVFKTATGDHYVATSSVGDGHFTVVLPPAKGGYYATIRHSGYIGRPFFRNATQSLQLRRLDRKKRLAMGRELRITVLPVAPVRLEGKTQESDLFLVPED